MKTVHIRNIEHVGGWTDDAGIQWNEITMGKLYWKVLRKDPLFHYFPEPDLVIRISRRICLWMVTRLLRKWQVEYEVYDYPYPDDPSKVDTYSWTGEFGQRFGEVPGTIVCKHPDFFLPLFHAHSVAAITLDEYDHWRYMERVIHCGFLMKCHHPLEECNILVDMIQRRREMWALQSGIEYHI